MRIFQFTMLLFTLFSCSSSVKETLETVDQVDLAKYSGLWYEIAAYPNRFEKGCKCVTAEYSIIDSTTVRVINTCVDEKSGKIKKIKGKAFPVESSNNSKLKVQFFWPFKGDYWVLYLDDEYKHAIVGSPDKKFLWILSREPNISKKKLEKLLLIIESKGFDKNKIRLTVQNC